MNEEQQFRINYNIQLVLSRWLYLGVGIIIFGIYVYLKNGSLVTTNIDGGILPFIFFGAAIANFAFLFLTQYVEAKKSLAFGRILGWLQVVFDVALVSTIVLALSHSLQAVSILFLIPVAGAVILLGGLESVAVAVICAFLVIILPNSLGPSSTGWGSYANSLVYGFAYISTALVLVYHNNFLSHLNVFLAQKHKKETDVTQSEQLQWVRKYGAKMEENNRRLYAKELELKMAREELETLDKAKSKFVSVTAHQMRTPLSGIKWTFNMMNSGQLGPVTEDQAKFLKQGMASVEQIITIVNSLLEIDKIESKKLEEFKIDAVNIDSLLESVVGEFNNQINSKKIKLDIRKPSVELPVVQADPGKIRIVLENLIDNAIKYTPENGQVTIEISDEKLNSANQTIEVLIRDSGIGIPYMEQRKVFSKFFRASNAVGSEPDGSGVGLFIAKDIIEHHNGSLWFESKAGQGTTFHFTLPLRQA
jgi:signal transduction histidine kinase